MQQRDRRVQRHVGRAGSARRTAESTHPVLHLQRSAGNAAATAAVQREEGGFSARDLLPSDQRHVEQNDRAAKRGATTAYLEHKRGKEAKEEQELRPWIGARKDYVKEQLGAIGMDMAKKAWKKRKGEATKEEAAEVTPEAERWADDQAKAYEEFLADVKAGGEKVKEHVEYANKAAEWYRMTGVRLPGVDASIKEVGDIAEKLGKHLGKLSDGLELISHASSLVDGFRATAGAFSGFDPARPESFRQLTEGLLTAEQRCRPAANALLAHLKKAAMTGESMAGASAFVTLGYVFIQLEAGRVLLEAGIRNEEAYFKRLHEKTDEAFDRQRPKPDPGLAPMAPAPFRTLEEQGETARLNREAAAWQQERRRKAEEGDAREQSSLPALYKRERSRIAAFIAKAYEEGVEGSSDWYDVMIKDQGVDGEEADSTEMPIKARVTAAELEIELEGLKGLGVIPGKGCPAFEALRTRARAGSTK